MKRKLQFLTKTLLVAAGLMAGVSSAWAESVQTIVHYWDFTVYADNTDVTTGAASITENSTTCNIATAPTACDGLYFQETWKCVRSGDTYPGLRNYSTGDRMVVIPNLKSGDIITITGNTDAINNINTTKYIGTKNAGNTTLTFTMEADGNFYFKMVKGGAKVNEVYLYPTIRTIRVTRNVDLIAAKTWDFTNASWAKESGFGASTVTINAQSCTYANGDLSGLALQGGSGTSWQVNSSGLRQDNGSRNIAILDLKAGDVVTVVTNVSGISKLVNGLSINDTYTGTCKFYVKADGTFGFQVERYTSASVNAYTASITVHRDLSNAIAEYNVVKGNAQTLAAVSNDNPSANATLNAAITAQNAVVAAAVTIDEINTAATTLQTAMMAYIAAANPTIGNQFDLSFLLTNPNIEDITDWGDAAAQGWFTDIPMSGLGDYNNFAARTNLNSSKNGIERYTSNVCPTANTYALYQKVTLPAGNYSFKANALANAVTTIVMAAGSTEGDAVTSSDFTQYSVDFTQASESEIKLGTKISSTGTNTCNWTAITELELYKEPASSITATLDNAGYATLASAYPLNVASASMTVSTGSATAYKAAIDGTVAKFTELDQTIPANTGILLKGTPNATVTIPVVASGDAVDGNAFLVNEGGATFAGDDDYYYFAMKKNAATLTFNAFVPGTLAFPANKAYLKVAKSNFGGGAPGAPSLTFDFGEGETTGINAVKGAEFTVNGEYYDLQGRRVAQPTKGLYIVNGKKVVIK